MPEVTFGKRLVALWFHLSYRLATHSLMQVSLQRWLWVWIALPPLLAFIGRLSWWLAGLISALGLLALAGTEWARRQEYVVFCPSAAEISPMAATPLADALQVDEPIHCWASGAFAVEGKTRAMAGEQGRVSYVRTREHIVMVYVWRTRFLLLAQASKGDVGWWYVFFQPVQVRLIRTGALICGLTVRQGLALSYECKDEAKVAQVYLAFEDEQARQRLLDDLRRDVVEEMF